MRAVVQRVREASVTVDEEVVGAIGPGLAVLVGVAPEDDEHDAAALAAKLAGLRIFADDDGRMNRSVVDVAGSVLIVSQFTLLADVRRGRRPSFVAAAPPDHAASVIAGLVAALSGLGVACQQGAFGQHMLVRLVNDGPVTIVIDVSGGSVA